MNVNSVFILGIESSCDETAAAVYAGNGAEPGNGKILSNIIASQKVHEQYGGVVPELASRAHQQNIVPVVNEALKKAGIEKESLSAVAYTKGPGLPGSLLVGGSFAKGFSLGLDIPLIEVDHLHGHVLAHFIDNRPGFPFICLLVSGGHTQIILVKDFLEMEVIGQTLDDAAGEAFDKSAKILGLPYPGGPLIDKFSANGNENAFKFPHPKIADFDFSFSGFKTSVLYFVRDELKKDENFVKKNLDDLCASIQKTICDILIDKLVKAAEKYRINQIALAGGVAANSGLRKLLMGTADKLNWTVYIPQFQYCTDNAAMISIAGFYKYLMLGFTEKKRILSGGNAG